MSTITPAQHTQSPEPLASSAIYRMTVAQYEQMANVLDGIEIGIIPVVSVFPTR
jgi:hypothetical protein